MNRPDNVLIGKLICTSHIKGGEVVFRVDKTSPYYSLSCMEMVFVYSPEG